MPDDQTSLHGNVIPPAIRRQGERADALVREISAAAAPATPEAPRPATTEVTPAAPTAPTTPAAPAAAAPTTPPTPTTPPAAEEDWEQRFRTLRGKYDSELPALNARARAAEQQIQQLQHVIASMQLAHANPATPATPATGAAPGAAPAGSITPEDVETWGDDLVSAARRWARTEVNPEIEGLRRELAQLRNQANNASQQSAQNAVHAALDGTVPKWREINNDPAFLAWLDQVDPFTGRKRHLLLGEAYTGGDAYRTAAFFNAFLTEHTATTQPPSPSTHTPPGRSQSGAGSTPLAELAAPGRGRPQSPGAPDPKRFFSRKEIAAFYRDVADGKWDGREPAKASREAEIFQAATEGRIQ